jgi:rhamnulokinase
LCEGIPEAPAFRYKKVSGWLEEVWGKRIDVPHIVGGGLETSDEQLCQFTANTSRRKVIAGGGKRPGNEREI